MLVLLLLSRQVRSVLWTVSAIQAPICILNGLRGSNPVLPMVAVLPIVGHKNAFRLCKVVCVLAFLQAVSHPHNRL